MVDAEEASAVDATMVDRPWTAEIVDLTKQKREPKYNLPLSGSLSSEDAAAMNATMTQSLTKQPVRSPATKKNKEA